VRNDFWRLFDAIILQIDRKHPVRAAWGAAAGRSVGPGGKDSA